MTPRAIRFNDEGHLNLGKVIGVPAGGATDLADRGDLRPEAKTDDRRTKTLVLRTHSASPGGLSQTFSLCTLFFSPGL